MNRNIASLADVYTTNIQTKDNYKDLIPTIQFNLNLCDVKKQNHVKNCYLVQDDSLLVARFYDPDKRREFYMEGFREEGREEGRLQGREQGIFKRNLEIVENMFKKKYKIEDIEEVTGLSKEEILKLKEKN